MTQREVNRAVALVTGESVAEIDRLGFGLADPDNVLFDPEPSDFDRYLDWDDIDARRQRVYPR
jgi:hypothetical protein